MWRQFVAILLGKNDEPVDGADKPMGHPQKQPAMGVEKHCIQCGYNQNFDK